jgi:hypothetical protein
MQLLECPHIIFPSVPTSSFHIAAILQSFSSHFFLTRFRSEGLPATYNSQHFVVPDACIVQIIKRQGRFSQTFPIFRAFLFRAASNKEKLLLLRMTRVSENAADRNEVASTALGDDRVRFVLLRLRLWDLLGRGHELLAVGRVEAVAFLDLPRRYQFHGLAPRKGVVRRGLKEMRDTGEPKMINLGEHLDAKVFLRSGRVVKARHLGKPLPTTHGVFLVELVSDLHVVEGARFHGTILERHLHCDRGTPGVLIYFVMS